MSAGGNGKSNGDDDDDDDDVTEDDAEYGWGDSSTSGFGDGWSSH